MRRPIQDRSRPGFTLIELLVVITVIALLIGILLPTMSAAMAAPKSTKCLSNTRTIAMVMQMFADDDPRNFYPTAQMPMTEPFELSWIYLTRPYVEQLEVYRCPSDESVNWDAMMMQRRTSYGINAYFTPNHPPYEGIRPDSIKQPSRTIIAAELVENVAMDHFMPMYWGNPPAVVNAMMQNRQWDAATQLPKTIFHTRHLGSTNYVFTDGHAATHRFSDTWVQNQGAPPTVDWYNPS